MYIMNNFSIKNNKKMKLKFKKNKNLRNYNKNKKNKFFRGKNNMNLIKS